MNSLDKIINYGNIKNYGGGCSDSYGDGTGNGGGNGSGWGWGEGYGSRP